MLTSSSRDTRRVASSNIAPYQPTARRYNDFAVGGLRVLVSGGMGVIGTRLFTGTLIILDQKAPGAVSLWLKPLDCSGTGTSTQPCLLLS
jgi:hypothetical protein